MTAFTRDGVLKELVAEGFREEVACAAISHLEAEYLRAAPSTQDQKKRIKS